eukprot:2114375-Pleurochrysis_carterae.AAC.1
MATCSRPRIPVAASSAAITFAGGAPMAAAGRRPASATSPLTRDSGSAMPACPALRLSPTCTST